MKRKIQSLVFQRSSWDKEEAIAWARDHKFATDQITECETDFALRQFEAPEGTEGSFQTVTDGFPEGVSALTLETDHDGQGIDPQGLLDSLDARVLAMMMKRAEPRPDNGLIFLKAYDSVIEKDGADNGRLKYTITTDAEDRMGDVIDPRGWFFGNYEKNPQVLFNHEYGEVAGSPPSQGRTLLMERFDHGLRAVVEFHRKTRFNNELYAMARDGYMPTSSVGFLPMERPEERETKAGGQGLHFTKQDLLEWSIVAVPANPQAYQEAMKKGIVRPRTVEYLSSLLAPYADRQGGEPAHGESRHKAAQEQERLDEVGAALNAALVNRVLSNRKRGLS